MYFDLPDNDNDMFYKSIGKYLLEYFESEEFPICLLHDPKLNLLHLRAQLMKIVKDESLSDSECFERIEAAIEDHNEKKSIPCPFQE